MLISNVKKIALIACVLACLLAGHVASAKANEQVISHAGRSGNALALGGKEALRSLLTRVGVDVGRLELAGAPGPLSSEANEVFASYTQSSAPTPPYGIKGLIVGPDDVLTVGWHERGRPFFRVYRYDRFAGEWVSFIQSNVTTEERAGTELASLATNTEEILQITFAPPTVVSTTTGVKSFTITNGNNATYFTIPLAKKIAALYIMGSVNGVVQVAGIGTSVLVASVTPAGTKGTVPVQVVYSDAACP